MNGAVYGGFEPFQLDRFDQMIRKAGLQTFLDVSIIAEATDGNSGNTGDGAQLHHQFPACSIRERNVADEEIEPILHSRFHGRADIVSCRYQMAAAHEQAFKRLASVLMIVDQENAQPARRRLGIDSADTARDSALWRRDRWDGQGKCRSLIAAFARGNQRSAVCLG